MPSGSVVAGLIGLFLCGRITHGQATEVPVSFEVASVKRIAPDGAAVGGGPFFSGGVDRLSGGPGTTDPERIYYGRVSIKRMLMIAYGLKDFQISGPASIGEDRYDVEAKLPPNTTADDAHLMLRNLLVERFGLRVSLVTKELPVYELAIAKNGPRLTPSGPLPPDTTAQASLESREPVPGALPVTGGRMIRVTGDGGYHMVAKRRPISNLIEFLEDRVARPVIDKTGLTETYDFTMDYKEAGLPKPSGTRFQITATGELKVVPPEDFPPSIEPSLFDALEKQLGLKLEASKGPVVVLLVEHADRMPGEN